MTQQSVYISLQSLDNNKNVEETSTKQRESYGRKQRNTVFIGHNVYYIIYTKHTTNN